MFIKKIDINTKICQKVQRFAKICQHIEFCSFSHIFKILVPTFYSFLEVFNTFGSEMNTSAVCFLDAGIPTNLLLINYFLT
jgi:hypothetical protein